MKWNEAEERVLLLLILQQIKQTTYKPDYQALLNAWPTNPASRAPTLRGVQDRFTLLRRAAAALVNGAGTSATATAQVPRARVPATRSITRVKTEDQAATFAAADDNASVGNAANFVPRTPLKPKAKKESAKPRMRIKVEDGADAATPTPASRTATATATGLPTPFTTTTKNGASVNTRKRHSATNGSGTDLTATEASTIESSEEAMSTDAGDNDDDAAPDSPTPAAKKPRRKYDLSTKPQVGVYASSDGPDSGDDDDLMMVRADIQKDWAAVKNKRAAWKRVKVVRDDSDEDWQDSESEILD